MNEEPEEEGCHDQSRKSAFPDDRLLSREPLDASIRASVIVVALAKLLIGREKARPQAHGG